MQHAVFICFQFGSNKTFGIHQGLTPLKCCWNALCLPFAHFDEVAKHFCVAHLQSLDASLFAQSLLVAGHPGFMVMSKRAQLVKLAIESFAEKASISHT